jgi:hypothetical protein
MAISISPLELKLDEKNPRFVVLSRRNQNEIRRYLLANEDVSQLATEINNNGNLFLGERIVIIREKNKYIVVEGNRRTCSLQLLLSRKLIPRLFEHKIPSVSEEVLKNCQKIEVDVIPDRNSALALMSRRHIEGVKQWKPLAKKQFFASNYNNGKGRSIENLSMVTGINKNEIRADIRDYKLFSKAYGDYKKEHPEFDKEVMGINIDPFLRLFKAKFYFPSGTKTSPLKFFEIKYDEQHNITNTVDNKIFEKIVKIAFEKAIITEEVNTRNTLTDIKDILPLLDKVAKKKNISQPSTGYGSLSSGSNDNISENEQQSEEDDNGKTSTETNSGEKVGGPRPGGPSPKSFFETISWRGKLDPKKKEHQGLLVSVHELYSLSTKQVNRKKAYEIFPIATGMVLRTAYEQALRLQLIRVSVWGTYKQTLHKDFFPTLGSIENFINQGTNKTKIFPKKEMVYAFDRIIAAKHREFLNANIHYPGNINVTADALKNIANGGMFYLIQGIIESL